MILLAWDKVKLYIKFMQPTWRLLSLKRNYPHSCRKRPPCCSTLNGWWMTPLWWCFHSFGMFLVVPGTWKTETWAWNLKADAEAPGEEWESRRHSLAQVDLEMGLGAECRCTGEGAHGLWQPRQGWGRRRSVCWGLAWSRKRAKVHSRLWRHHQVHWCD